MSEYGVFPPKIPPKVEWISLSSALTWLIFNHAMELHEVVEWGAQTYTSEDELSQLFTERWQQLIDHRWSKVIQIRAKARGSTDHRRLSAKEWRPFRFVSWQHGSKTVQLLREPFPPRDGAGLGGPQALALDDPIIWRADIITFKKVRRRTYEMNTVPDYERAERDLRAMLSEIQPQTGLKWEYVDELVGTYGLPEYQAVKLWTKVSQELGFPQRGRPTKNSRHKIETIKPVSRIFWEGSD